MKPVFKAVLFLGLAMPSLSGATEIDFDGKNKINANPINVLNEVPSGPIAMPATPKPPPEMIRVMERLTETGEFVEVVPETIVNEAGKKVDTYTIQPNWAVRWKVSCPGEGNWGKRITYSWDTAAGVHNHSNPPPPPLLFSNSQSAQFPPNTDWAYTPSPINFPVMQGYNKLYYYWMWYPEFATKLVEWTEAWGSCVSKREEWTYVREVGLVEIKAGVGYTVDGDTTKHPATHYVTPDFKTQLQAIGAAWNKTCPNSTKPYPLTFLQMSLPWGGLFDVNGNWKPPHSGHRFGNHADVSKWRVRKGNRAKLVRTMCDYANVYSEGDEEYEDPHYHVVLRTSKHTEDFPDPLDERFMDCCLSPGVPLGCINLETGGQPSEEHSEVPVETDCP